MRELIAQHGEAIAEAAGAILVIGILSLMTFGGGLSDAIHFFSSWLLRIEGRSINHEKSYWNF